MIDNLIDKLKDIGFKEYEAKVFLVLLKRKALSASSIAKEAGIIRNSIYDILKSFIDKGYINEIETGTVNLYEIIDPKIVFDKIERDSRKHFNDEIELIKKIQQESEPIYKQAIKENSQLRVELIRGFNKHRVAKYLELLETTNKELLGMYNLKGLVLPQIDKTVKQLIKKGGIVRTIYSSNLDFKVKDKDGKNIQARKEDLLKILQSFASAGEDIRISETEIPNMTIFDCKNVFLNLNDKDLSKEDSSDLIIKYASFTDHMKILFEHYWESSITLQQYKNKNLLTTKAV